VIEVSVSRVKGSGHRSRLLILPAAAGAAVAIAACGSSGSGGGIYGSAAASPAAANPTAASTALTVRHTSLGTIITNNRGFTLYAFEADKGTKSACSGACASAWPPVTTTSGSSIKVTGAAKSLVGVAKQANGILQVTYAGHLLYRFQGDGSPGSTNGQGSTAFGARWDVLTPTGTEVKGV
jgi:predicted lipoprotein with Yx(FWY)xxD motif